MRHVALVLTAIAVLAALILLALMSATAPAIAQTGVVIIEKSAAQDKGKEKGKEKSPSTIPSTGGFVAPDGAGGLLGLVVSALAIGGVIWLRIWIRGFIQRFR